MNRDKQMINDLIEIFDEEYGKRYLITPQNTADKLTAKGYRKSTDLAREIFEEIEDCYVQMLEEADNTIEEAILDGNHIFVRASRYGKDVMLLTFDTLRKRLKKKYLGSEKDDER